MTSATAKNVLQVLGVVKSDALREALVPLLAGIAGAEARVAVRETGGARHCLAGAAKNTLALLEVDEEDLAEATALLQENSAAEGAGVPVIILSAGLGPGMMLQLLRAGACDFLSLPPAADELRAAIRRAAASHRLRLDGSDSKIIAFVHASGGAGATTLAVNAATLIQDSAPDKKSAVCLLDFDLQFGGASAHLDLSGYSPVMELINTPERLDPEMLEGMMIPTAAGLRVLTAPESPLPMDALGGELVARLLQTAQMRYDYVVIDMPQTLTQWTDAALKKAQAVYAVTQMNVPHIRQLRRWLAAIAQEGMHALPLRITANRHHALPFSGGGDISASQAAEALGREIDFFIPNDYALIAESLARGVPAVALDPRGGFARQLGGMLHGLAPEIPPPPRNFLGLNY